MNPFISLLLTLAQALAPKADKLWLADMRLEAAFVPNKLRFALAALGLAFRFRFTSLRLNRPVGFAFGSVALAALAILFVPRLFSNNTALYTQPTPASESVQDMAEERGYSAEAQTGLPEAMGATTPAEAPIDLATQADMAEVPAEGATDSAKATDLAQATTPEAQSSQPLATAPTEQEPASVTAAESIDAPLPSLARIEPNEPLAQEPLAIPPPAAMTVPATPQSENAVTPQSPAEEQDRAASVGLEPNPETNTETAVRPPTPATPGVDTEVISTQVTGVSVLIEVQSDALLTLYRDTNFSGSPRLNRYVTRGETFTANAPFSLYTDNAAAIKITLDDESYSLGKTNEEQFRIFSKP